MAVYFTIDAVAWNPSDDPFLGAVKYTATVTLTADTGYTFFGLGTATINGNPVTIESNTGDTVTLSYEFPQTVPVSAADVNFGGGPEDETIDLSGDPAEPISWNTGSLTVAVDTSPGAWASGAIFAWYLDGKLISGETDSTITIMAKNYLPGTHYLFVDVSKNEDAYSKTLIFTITQ